jgi:hypothetical protein
MDLSKLPKLSASDPPTPPQQQPPSVPSEPLVPLQYSTSGTSEVRSPGDAIVSLLIALILLAINPRPLAFLRHTFTGHAFDYQFWDEKNAPLDYTHSVFFIGDFALLIFALAVLMESAVLALRPTRPLVLIALAMTVIAAGLNLFYVVWMYNTYGLQLISAVAVVFGAYTASWQWRLIKLTSRGARHDYLL